MKKLIFILSFLLAISFCFSQIQQIPINSEGVELNAYMYQSEGDGLKPTIIWCHGNPGGKEKGESKLAIELNNRGMNVIRFNYRGLWGTEGTYTPGNCQEDLNNILNFVLEKENSSSYKIDATRIIVAGYSHGSNVAIVSALHDDRIKEIISLGIADFSYLIRETFNPHNTEMKKFNQEVKDAIWGDSNEGQGKYARDYDKYVFDILFNNYKYDFVAQSEKLKDKRMFFIVGMNDMTVPIEHHFFPLFRKLKKMGHEDFDFEITESDHSFREISSTEKADMIANWINKK